MMRSLMMVEVVVVAASVVMAAGVDGGVADLPALRMFAQRVLRDDALAARVEFRLVHAPNEFFMYETIGSKLIVSGTTSSALTAGLGWYLKYDANVHISWSGDQMGLDDLPSVPARVFRNRTVPITYYMNVCTFSYSTVHWDWARWERELDWMALNGINTPLASTGQEFILRQIFTTTFNMTRRDLDEFFTGPSFLAWNRMGNIRGWAGPLPDFFIDDQRDLQLLILARARSLGMKVVLPAFAGHVPEAARRIWPDVDIRPSSSWNNFEERFTNVFMVQPDQDLFVEIGKAFVREIIVQFGTDHLYSADTFNENAPRSLEPGFLARTAAATLASMSSSDPLAVWVMQDWLFTDSKVWSEDSIEAYLSGVPDHRLIILDLFSDVVPFYKRPEAFYGKPWVFNMLHNFGGNHGLYGRAQVIGSAPVEALSSSQGKMVGIGLTPEGIEQNYVMYELMLEMAWRSSPVDLDRWFDDFAIRRYGEHSENAAAAWRILQQTVYNSDDYQWGVTKSMMVMEPALQYRRNFFMNPIPFYSPDALVTVWWNLLQCSDQFHYQSTYRYDLVDVTRQILSDLFKAVHDDFGLAADRRDLRSVELSGSLLLSLLLDMDRVLATSPDWLLGTWLERARRAASDHPLITDHFLFNAKNQITMWGPRGEITDYASKQWAGLIAGYHLPRWRRFVDAIVSSVKSGRPFDRHQFRLENRERSRTWQRANGTFQTEHVGDTIEVSKALYSKYALMIANKLPVSRCRSDQILADHQ